MLASALESDWVKLLEDIGLWIPSFVNNYEINNRPENASEYGNILLCNTDIFVEIWQSCALLNGFNWNI